MARKNLAGEAEECRRLTIKISGGTHSVNVSKEERSGPPWKRQLFKWIQSRGIHYELRAGGRQNDYEVWVPKRDYFAAAKELSWLLS